MRGQVAARRRKRWTGRRIASLPCARLLRASELATYPAGPAAFAAGGVIEDCWVLLEGHWRVSRRFGGGLRTRMDTSVPWPALARLASDHPVVAARLTGAARAEAAWAERPPGRPGPGGAQAMLAR